MKILDKRTARRKRHTVTDQEVEQWVADEEWASRNAAAINVAQFTWGVDTTEAEHPPLGNVPAERPDSSFRLLSVQINSLSPSRRKNIKAAMLQWLIKRYEVNLVGIGELGLNMSLMGNGHRLLSIFPELDLDTRSSVSYNEHESISLHQQGGVGMILLGEILPYYKPGSKDFRRLGRWDSSILTAKQGHVTRVVHSYGVLPRASKEIGSVDQQHVRYIQSNLLEDISPRDLFESDFIWQLQYWRSQGERLILMMDANCHVLTGRLSRALAHESIGLREITKDLLGELCPNTHGRGSQPIDGVWTTPDIVVTAIKWLPFSQSPGDHRACIFDVTMQSVLGTSEKRVVYPACRRLISSNPAAVAKYEATLREQFKIHRIEERMDRLEEDAADLTSPLPQALERRHNCIDSQVVELQIHSEKGCRHIYRPDSPFTLDYSIWHKRARVFSRMQRMVEGRVRQPSLLCQQARKLGIMQPRQWTLEQIQEGRRVCKAWKRELELYSPALRKEHLVDRLIEAEANGQTERAKAIRALLTKEDSRNLWGPLRYHFNPNGGRGNAVTRVERIENGTTVEYTSQSDVERVVREETQSRFSAAESSPFCQGLLGQELGYISDTETAAAILTGTYEIPSSVSDATALLIDEIGRVGKKIVRGAVRLSVLPEEFREYWQPIPEKTSSSASRAHFGHYKTASKFDWLCNFFAKKLSFVSRTGSAPARWGIGLTVLLEKIAGQALVNKLRAILLMEADFQMLNRLIFANRAMALARSHGLIPDEQYAERQSDGQDGAWLKRLFADVSRQARAAFSIISADAANCYDRIAHAFASLVFQAFGVYITMVSAMLTTIQNMKFFLRTGFGESTVYMTAVLGAIIHGLCQGNTAAPAGWSLISAILLAAYKRMGHGAVVETPISRMEDTSAGVLFVDDVDLFVMNLRVATPELWQEAVDCAMDWSCVLHGPGGTAVGEKCFGYLLDYRWLSDGSWEYYAPEGIDLKVCNADGTIESIALLGADEARVTLGIATTPSGNDWHHLNAPGKHSDKWRSVKTKAENWLSCLSNCHLPPRFCWVSYRLQLWASLQYGLGVLSARLGELGELTTNFAFRALPHLGINRNIRAGWRYLHTAFGGCNLLDLGTESVIARLNMFLQHWDNPSQLGHILRTSMEYLQLEVGCQGCPLHEPFFPMGEICTHSWLRSFWEMISRYKLNLVVDMPVIPLPRENDIAIMALAVSMGYVGDALRSINRCRLFCNAVFLSCLASASGKHLDHARVRPSSQDKSHSRYSFQNERPSVHDWQVWEQFWVSYCLPDGSLPRSLGKWLSEAPRIWEWFYNEREDVIEQYDGCKVWRYCRCVPDSDDAVRTTRGRMQYARTGEDPRGLSVDSLPVSVQLEQDCIVKLASGPPLATPPPSTPDNFWTHLRAFGGAWMWDHVELPLGLDTVVESISSGTAVFVTDGSYNRGIRRDLDAAGWLIYCTNCRRILLRGSFHERNAKAGSYRGELLGLLAIHAFLLAVETIYLLPPAYRGLVVCDNLGALNKAQEKRKKIPAGAKHADIRRCLRKARAKLVGSLTYKHVYGHQDKKKKWHQLTVLEKLNCKCDTLAKLALDKGIRENPRYTQESQQLPLEAASVYYNSVKLSSECGAEIRFQVGKSKAREFYLGTLGWFAAVFDSIDWEARDKALESKPDMFKTWLCKQSSGFCATGTNMQRWFGDDITNCPNCGVPGENAAHLLHCPDAGRFGLFRQEVISLQAWLEQSHTHPELARLLPQYILGRGAVKFASLPIHSVDILRLAHQQDTIGWDSFMEGKISHHFSTVQYSHLRTADSMLTSYDWTHQFISKLLHITHGQWIYRNISKNHAKHGLLRSVERRKLLREIDRYMNLPPEDVPEESRFLLEIDFSHLRHDSTEKQSYWVHAIRAAVTAGRRRVFVTRRRQLPPHRSTATARPPIDFGPTDSHPFRNHSSAPPAARCNKRSGSFTDPSNKRRKPD